MQIVDKLFLGSEFTTWLYFHLLKEGLEVSLPDAFKGLPAEGRDNDIVSFAIGKKMRLTAIDETGPAADMSGPGLGDNGEVLHAIHRGALIRVLSLEMSIGSRVYGFTLNADDAALTGVKLPDLFTDPNEDQGPETKAKRKPKLPLEDVFALRMTCLREIESVVDALFAKFLALRLSRDWVQAEVPEIQRAVNQGLLMSMSSPASV